MKKEIVNTENTAMVKSPSGLGKAALYNALVNPDYNIGDVNDDIVLVFIASQQVTIPNAETGEQEELTKYIFVDADGKSYYSFSQGVADCVRAIGMIFGEVSAENPVKVHPRRMQRGKNQRVVLDLID